MWYFANLKFEVPIFIHSKGLFDHISLHIISYPPGLESDLHSLDQWNLEYMGLMEYWGQSRKSHHPYLHIQWDALSFIWFTDWSLFHNIHEMLPSSVSEAAFKTPGHLACMSSRGCRTKTTWSWYKLFSLWQCSFHIKAALPLVEWLVTISYNFL